MTDNYRITNNELYVIINHNVKFYYVMHVINVHSHSHDLINRFKVKHNIICLL